MSIMDKLMFWRGSKAVTKSKKGAPGKSEGEYMRDLADYIRESKFGPETRSAVYNHRRMEFIKGKDFAQFVRDNEEKLLEIVGGEVRYNYWLLSLMGVYPAQLLPQPPLYCPLEAQC